MKLLVTPYKRWTGKNGLELQITNGFSHFEHLLDDYKHFFVEQGNDKHKRLLQERAADADEVYLSILFHKQFKEYAPLLSDKWLIGGPYIEKRDSLDSLKEKVNGARLCAMPYEKYIGQEKLSDTWTPYFYPFLDKLPPIHWVTYACSIGDGCYWGHCTFCGFYAQQRKLGLPNKLMLRNGNFEKYYNVVEKPYFQEVNSTMDAVPPKYIPKMVEAGRYLHSVNASYRAYIIPQKQTLEQFDKFDDLSGIHINIGPEVLSQEGLDILKKGQKIEDVIEMCKITQRGASVQINLIHNWNFFTNDMHKEAIDVLKKIRATVKVVHNKQRVYWRHGRICNWHDYSDVEDLVSRYGGTPVQIRSDMWNILPSKDIQENCNEFLRKSTNFALGKGTRDILTNIRFKNDII